METIAGNNTEKEHVDPLAAPQWALDVEVIYLFLIILIGIPGNMLILLVQKKNSEKSSTDYYVLTMAAFELLCSSLNTTMRIFANTQVLWEFFASPAWCSFRQFFTFCTSMSSAFLLSAIAVDRYVKTCKPLSIIYNPSKAKAICLGISVASVICSSHTLGTYVVDDFNNCVLRKETENMKKLIDMLDVTLTIIVYLITTVCYIVISLTLRKRHKQRVNAKLIPANSGPSTGGKSNGSIFNLNRTKVAPVTGSENSEIKPKRENVDLTSKSELNDNTDYGPQETNGPEQSTRNPNALKHLNEKLSDANDSGNVEHGQPLQASANFNTLFRIRQQEQTLNRTTRIMCLISVVYIFSWITSWLRVILGPAVLGAALDNFARSFYMVTCVANPLFFFGMSSKFRENAGKLIFCRKDT